MPIPREPAFEVAEYRRRLERVHRSMASRSLDALVLFSPHNVFYLSGMDTENLSDYQCLLVPAGGDPILVTSHFEEARAANSCWHRGQVFYGPFEDPIQVTLDAVRRLKVRALGLERRNRAVSPDHYQSLAAALSDLRIEDPFGVVEHSRLVKSPSEIACMRRAAILTDLGVEAAYGAMKEGQRDSDVAAAIMEAMYGNGSDTVCWGPIVAAGYRAGSAHSTFMGLPLRRGQTVFLELTAEVRHYTAPLMRTAVLGSPTDDMKRVEAAGRAALACILEEARPGVPADHVARTALAILEPVLPGHVFHYNFGYPVGIGYPPSWIEELDFLMRADNPRPLQAGMTFHLPMSVRKYGEYGVNLSQTILVGEDETEALARTPARLHRVRFGN